MPDAGLTPEEVDAMLAEAAQDDAEDCQRVHARRNQELAEMDLLEGEVDDMLEEPIIGGVVDQDVLRNREMIARERERAQAREREQAQDVFRGLADDPADQGNLVNVAGQVMQLIEGGRLWAHVDEPNVQLRVVQANGDDVTVAPVGITAQVGLPRLFRLNRKVFTDHFRFISRRQQQLLPQGDRDYAADRLAQLSDEHLKDKEPEEDNVERRTLWERLMDEDDDSLG